MTDVVAVDAAVIKEKTAAARLELEYAEAGLGVALREVQVAPRAEKTTISLRLEEAFERMRAARQVLAELDALVTASD